MFNTLLSALEEAVDRALRAGAERVAAAAREAVLAGSPTGRAYRRGRLVHIASAPGQAPASDSGALAASIVVEPSLDGGYDVIATAPYALTLEFGGTHVSPRPFLVPALDAHRDDIRQDAIAAAQRAIDKGETGT